MPARTLLALVATLMLAVGLLPPASASSQPQPNYVNAVHPLHVDQGPESALAIAHAGDTADGPSTGTFRCATPGFAERNRLLHQQIPFRPLSVSELQALGRADAAGFIAQDTLGQVKQFWAHNVATGQPYQVSATLQRMTAHGYVYVDNLRPISSSALDAMATEWEKIYATVTGVFGDIPDVDGDPRVTILILDILDGSTGGGYVAGYFNSSNELPGVNSNLREMFYIDSNPGVPGDQTSLFTLAHEFQHMINWNYHKSDSGQDTWLNEGLSDLAGFLSGYGHDDNLVSYLRDPNDSLINWGNAGKDYGSVYLFMLYLWERYGGNPTARTIAQHPGLSIDAVDAGLTSLGTPDRFRQAFQKWTAANYLGDRVSAGGTYGYQNLTLVSGGENNHTSFRRAAVSGSFTAFPVTQSATVQHWGVRYYTFTGGSGSLGVSVNGPDNSPFGVNVAGSSAVGFSEGTNSVTQLVLNAAQDGSTTVTGFGTTTQGVLAVASSQEHGTGSLSFSLTAQVTAASPATATPTGSATPAVTATPATPTPTKAPATATPTATSVATNTPAPTVSVAPTLAGPSEGSTLSSVAVTLIWANPPTTTQYQVQILPANNDGPGLNLIRNAESSFVVPAPVLGLGPYILLPDMSYQWRVRATSKPTFAPENDPAWGPWSSLRRFRTPRPGSSAILPLDPSNGATVPAAARDLRWLDGAAGVFYYEIQVSGDTRFDANPATATSFVWWNLVHGGVTNPLNSWRTPALAPNTTYYWRARPRVQGDGSPVPWSATFTFKTGPQ